MKRILIAFVALVMMVSNVNAQRLVNITAEARYITDRMIVELGLDNFQRNGLMQINLNYLSGINSYRDINSKGWRKRNKALRAMLSASQWNVFRNAYYFYRPIEWCDNGYVHNIYKRYPKDNWRRDNARRYDRPRPDGPHFGPGPRPDGPRFDRGPRPDGGKHRGPGGKGHGDRRWR